MIVFHVAKDQQFVQHLRRIFKNGAFGCPVHSCEKKPKYCCGAK